MILPCADPRDAAGLEQGYREIAETADSKLIIYLKDESNFGPDKETGLDVVARLVEQRICAGIKYAIVRADPSQDAYLESLLQRVDRRIVISGIGERPVVNHLRAWKLPGFTTGSGCVAPRLSQMLFAACEREDFEAAEIVRGDFIPLEDLRDAWGPAKVLHETIHLAGIARTGPIAPYVSGLSAEQKDRMAPVALTLVKRNSSVDLSRASYSQ
jgi:dihydrodipicolinate synthase/N-acetylneuraminate lyase